MAGLPINSGPNANVMVATISNLISPLKWLPGLIGLQGEEKSENNGRSWWLCDCFGWAKR